MNLRIIFKKRFAFRYFEHVLTFYSRHPPSPLSLSPPSSSASASSFFNEKTTTKTKSVGEFRLSYQYHRKVENIERSSSRILRERRLRSSKCYKAFFFSCFFFPNFFHFFLFLFWTGRRGGGGGGGNHNFLFRQN